MKDVFLCEGCRQERIRDERNEGHALLAKEFKEGESWADTFNDMNIYMVSKDSIVVHICDHCIKKDIRNTYFLFLGILLAGCLLIYLEGVMNTENILLCIGIIFIYISIHGAFKFWPDRSDVADARAVGIIYKRFKEKGKNDETVKLFTRKENQNMIKLGK